MDEHVRDALRLIEGTDHVHDAQGRCEISIDSQDVGGIDDLHRVLAEWPIGESVTLSILRGRERINKDIVPAEA